MRNIFTISMNVILAGCTLAPANFDVPYSKSGVPLANSVVQRIRCELAELIRDDLEVPYLRRATLIEYDYHTAMLLSLDANDTASVTPSLTFPISGVGFNITPSAKLSRQDQINYNLSYSMVDLYWDWKAHPADYACPDPNTNLAGNLGIREKVSSALNLVDLAFVTEAKPTDGQFSGIINFTATKSINQAGPTWVLVNFVGPGPFLAASEVNTDKLAFGFAAGKGIKPVTEKRPLQQRASTASQADQALSRALTNDLGTQLNAIRSNQSFMGRP
jgi:hypothetical protein